MSRRIPFRTSPSTASPSGDPLRIQNSSLCLSASWRPNLSSRCFHSLSSCFSRLPAGLLAGKPFLLSTIRIAPACPLQRLTASVSRCLCGKSLLFMRLRALCRRQKSHLPWNQQLPDSFAKTPGWGVSIHDENVFPLTSPIEFPSQKTSARALFVESRAVAAFQFRNHYLPEPALC